MDTNERVIQALHEFENMTDADKVLTQELEDLFVQIAHTGRIQIPWIYFKPVFMFKMDKVMRDFFESSPSRNNTSTEPTHTAEFDVMRQRLLDCIESFTSAPFTVQRLCELMVEPKRHYKSSDKFMRGVEKNVLVVSTISDMEGEELTNNHQNTNIPNGPVTNGIITTASTTEMEPVDERESNGQHTEHYHDTPYPTTEEIQQHCNGDTTMQKSDISDSDNNRIEESPSVTEEKVAEQTLPDENKNPEDTSLNQCSDDSSKQDSKQMTTDEQTAEMDKNEPKSKENNCNTVEEKKVEDKEGPKEESQEQVDTKTETNQPEELTPSLTDEEPMEE